VKLGALVEITWRDAWSDDVQTYPANFKNEMLVITVGWVARDTKDIISIASERFPDDTCFRGITHIYKPLVKKVRRLGDPDR